MTFKIKKPEADRTTPEPALKQANIKYIGRVEYFDKSKRKVERENAPVDRFSDAGTLVELPPADFQKRRRLFYHESAARIAATFPNLYKLVISKRS